MKYIFLILLLSITDPLKTTKINSIKKEAGEAYKAGNYEKAATKYSLLADSLGVTEDEILLNLGHSYYHLGDTSGAKHSYQSLLTSSSKDLKSIASQQLGVMAKDAQKLEESLSYLKNAIKANPGNEGAKYDYEVVKKLLEQQQNQQNQDQENQDQNQDSEDQENQDQNEQDQDQENQDQEKQDQQKSDEQKESEQQKSDEQKDGEEKEGEQKEQEQEQEGEKSEDEKQREMDEATKQKLQEMNISEEKARMILEALRNNEIQYIQQQKRQSSEPQNSGKPDW
ncbi:MAG: tetratricopeptide repeat protein [Cyclobacteriaceae bacterium]